MTYEKLYTKMELAPPQKSGMRLASVYAQLPHNLCVKVITKDGERYSIWVSDFHPVTINYVLEVLNLDRKQCAFHVL
ncbi:hypothetical protein K6U27_04620 [Vibrio fluvialis]|uniref:hypothetical protein n=1 Tax=Vibrio fluvialis TaxID=676 RepID=UPI001EEA6D34|nr:hypothetical protein [Vibrio fluvialis]MCG6371980.1 hypothetical protein [Vibrio fluvialis]